MAVVNRTMTIRGPDAVAASGPSQKLVTVVRVIEVGSADSDTSTYVVCDVPSNARLVGHLSAFSCDDLASSGSPTMDLGTFTLKGSVTTDDPNSLLDGLVVTSAITGTTMPIDIANDGKTFWELAGNASDLGGNIRIKLSLVDADVNAGGSVRVVLSYLPA